MIVSEVGKKLDAIIKLDPRSKFLVLVAANVVMCATKRT
jgi:hypothetical protein